MAYEIDNRLEEVLDENLKDCHNVNVIFDDLLNRNLKEDIESYEYDNLYVVANIPYYITTPILMKIIDSKLPFEKVTIMIQKEVGDRFTASVKTKSYGSITVFLNYYFDIKKLFVVNKNAFTPKPNVDSVVISLIRKKEKIKVKDEELLFQIIRDAFHFKRKNLRNNLKNYDLEKIQFTLEKMNKSLMNRAEELTLEEFITIANSLCE